MSCVCLGEIFGALPFDCRMCLVTVTMRDLPCHCCNLARTRRGVPLVKDLQRCLESHVLLVRRASEPVSSLSRGSQIQVKRVDVLALIGSTRLPQYNAGPFFPILGQSCLCCFVWISPGMCYDFRIIQTESGDPYERRIRSLISFFSP